MSKPIFILFGIFVLAYFLRVMFLPQLSLTFGYDQARDAYIAQQIIGGDLKILGPPSSTPGLYHGVFYYYLLAPAYWLGNGSPIAAAYWIALLNTVVVFIVFSLTWLLVKKTGAALLAAFFFAIAFESNQYATWLSNPTIGIWTVPLIYLGLWLWINPIGGSGRGKWWGSLLTALGLGLSIQANIFLAYHIPPLVLWLWLGRKNIKKTELLRFIIFLSLTLSTMIISEIKFGFKGLAGVTDLFFAQDAIVASKGLGDFILLFLNQLGRVFAYSSYPGNIGYGGVFILGLIVIALLYWKKKDIVSWQPFLATWLFAHITVTSVGGTSTPFLLVGIGPAVSILLGIFVYQFWQKNKALVMVILMVVIFSNMTMIIRENPRGASIFAIQKDMLLKKQIEAIDYTYQEAKGQQFSINSLTSPLWINIVWTYLYKWYGLSKYGYIPEWHGKDQIGQLDTLSPTDENTKIYFLILEPMGGIPTRYLPETIAEEDAVSILENERPFGELIVQKRNKIIKN